MNTNLSTRAPGSRRWWRLDRKTCRTVSFGIGVLFLLLAAIDMAFIAAPVPHRASGGDSGGVLGLIGAIAFAVGFVGGAHYLAMTRLPKTFALAYLLCLIGFLPMKDTTMHGGLLENILIVMLVAPIATPVLRIVPWVLRAQLTSTPEDRARAHWQQHNPGRPSPY